MDSDFFCSLCKLDCVDDTGILLHVLSEKHCIAYQTQMRSITKTTNDSQQRNYKSPVSDNRREMDMLRDNVVEPLSAENVKSETPLMKSNVLVRNTQGNLVESVGNDLYCRLCDVDFADVTDKLHHMLSVNHCIAYQKIVRAQTNSRNYGDYSKMHCKQNDRSECHTNKSSDNVDAVMLNEFPDVTSSKNPNSAKDPCFKNSTGEVGFSANQEEFQQMFRDELTRDFWEKMQLKGSNHDSCPEVKSKNKKSKKKKKKKKITEDCHTNITLNPVKLSNDYLSEQANSGFDPKNIISKEDSNICKDTSEYNSLNDSFVMERNEAPKSNGVILKRKKKIKGFFSRITVKGFTSSVNEIMVKNFFSKFGNIKLFEVIGFVLCIEYNERSAIDKIFAGHDRKVFKLSINGQNVEVKENIFKSSKDYCVGNLPCDMKVMFSSKECFQKKFGELLSNIDLGSNEAEKQNSVCSSVVECLKLDFDPSAHTFGSRVTGLATKNSDLDIYLDIKHPAEFVETKQEHSTQESIVLCARQSLRTCEDFESVLAIINARTPIVQFLHKPTGIRCDLSFQAPFGLFNTALVKYLLSLDYRVKPLMAFIRNWSSTHGLIRKGRLSNYCLALMIIFYLQQPLSSPVLPTILFLMKLAKESEKITIGSWECGFSTNFSLIPKSTNKSTVFQLIRGFFKFYSEFDFDNFVICPFLGKPINKKHFLPEMEYELPQDFFQYISNFKANITKPLDINCILCVQDPFVHSHNTARQTGRTISQNFKTYCELYADVCDSVDKIFDFSSVCESVF